MNPRFGQLHRHARLATGPGLRPDFLRSDFGAGLSSPSCDGGFEEFLELLLHLRRQVRNLCPQLLQLPGQRPDLRVLRRQQLPAAARSRLAGPAFARAAQPAHSTQRAYQTQAAHWQSRPSVSNTTRKADRQSLKSGTSVQLRETQLVTPVPARPGHWPGARLMTRSHAPGKITL